MCDEGRPQPWGRRCSAGYDSGAPEGDRRQSQDSRRGSEQGYEARDTHHARILRPSGATLNRFSG